MVKRSFDVVFAMLGLVLLSPILVAAACLVRLTSPGPVLFRQERIGRGCHPFTIYKFRTMVADAAQRGAAITCGDDPRITRVGRLLRKTKIDELPQLFNVLRGDMSFVGPRPEVRRYVDLYPDDYREILSSRPGITDIASITYRDEAAILARADDPQAEYVQTILPHKIRLAKEYRRKASLLFDLGLIVQTLAAVCRPVPTPEQRSAP